MKKNNALFLLFTFLICCFGFAQNITINGNVEGEEGVENIHVINRTQKLYETTNDKGAFKIEAKKSDTLVLTSVQYKSYFHVVTQENINSKSLKITLEVNVNELPEALIGFTLTGDLTKDVVSSDAKRPIDFYDVGIPGYKGKRKTKSERLLAEAGDFKPKMLLGLLTGGIPLNPIINGISGRTKELKKRVALEANTKLMITLKNNLGEAFFKENPLDEKLHTDFFYFCSEDPDFTKRCRNGGLEALKFMKEKYIKYKENLTEKE